MESSAPEIPASEMDVPEKALGGLVNMGLTCYANSVIQAFRNCKKLPWIFQEGRYNTLYKKEGVSNRLEMEQSLTSTFANVIQLLQKCKRRQNVRPADFWKKFKLCVNDTGFEHLQQIMPHDSHEFYICILDILHEALAQETDMRIICPPPTDERGVLCVKALETWRRYFSKEYSPLVDLFYGLQHIVVTCKGCNNKSHSWEPFTSLKASIHPLANGAPAPTIFELLKDDFKGEEISDYVCEKCSPERQVAVKTLSIWRLPQYFTFVLKRFMVNHRKISTPVASLPASGEEPVSFDEFFSPDSPELQAKQTFMLHSIVDHHGGAGGGHYTAQCKSNGRWQLYDDESVHTIPSAMFGSSTYMLWFERA